MGGGDVCTFEGIVGRLPGGAGNDGSGTENNRLRRTELQVSEKDPLYV